MDTKKQKAILMAILAAACYGISSPMSKILLLNIPPIFMAALLYLGAGLGMAILYIFNKLKYSDQKEATMTRKDLPYIIGMIILDIAAPICMMIGLSLTSSANASLLNNFEIVATSVIALFVFKEAVGRRMWIAVSLITLSSIILSFEDLSSFSFSIGSIFVLLACICWGFENNCTRMLSLKNPLQIVIIKGFGSGIGSLLISFVLKEYTNNIIFIFLTLLLGFFAYGLSIYFYILAQRELGASRTSAYYAIAPFIGVGLSIVLYKQAISISFGIALTIMMLGTYFTVYEKHKHHHIHEYLEHEHKHAHNDAHHTHLHEEIIEGEHSHLHAHTSITHTHNHFPDLHHIHSH